MKRRNKLILIIVGVMLAMLFGACGVSEDDSMDQQDNKQEQTQDERDSNSQEMRAELSAKLDISMAWQAVNSYGKEQYDGFAVRFQPGLEVTETAADADTWYLKAACTVNGEVKTCEARVTGTNDNPQVIAFEVY